MKKKKNGIIKITIIIAIIGLIIGIYAMYKMYIKINVEDISKYEVIRTTLSTDASQNVDENNSTIADMIEDVTRSVVGISKLSSTGGSILNNVTSEELGLGTGIIVSEDGYILSNSHVTGEKYSTCYITIDENTYKGTVIWSNEELDLAIVKIKGKNLKYAVLGDSKKLRVGEQVYAIGNPIGYEFRKTVTSGIISALNRTIKIDENEEVSYISDLIQTDATINPGNSGGPLTNAKGEIIGINTVKITSAEGIGFAIPVNVIKPVIDSFKTKGIFSEATLGILAYDGDVAEYMKLKEKSISGIYVSKVNANGPSYKSGLKEGDVILSIDGVYLENINDLRGYIYSKIPEDIVNLRIKRGRIEQDIQVILGRK